jgi:PII-like signaling protein
MGYGRHRRIHTRGLFGVVDAKPITILYLDDQEKIMAVLPVVLPMVKERLVAVQDIERVSA